MSNLNILNDSNTKEITFNNNTSSQNIDLSQDLGLEILDLDSMNSFPETTHKPNLVVHNKGDTLNTINMPLDNLTSGLDSITSDLDSITMPSSTQQISSLSRPISPLNNSMLPGHNTSNLDLGLDLLANQNKKKMSDPNLSKLNNISLDTHNLSSNNQSKNINTSSLNHISSINPSSTLNHTSSMNPSSTLNRTSSMNPSANVNPPPLNKGDINPSTPDIGNNSNINLDNEPKPIKNMTQEEIQKEKTEILSYFDRLEKRGIRITKRFNLSSNLDDMRYEKKRIIEEREAENSIKFQRKMMKSIATIYRDM